MSLIVQKFGGSSVADTDKLFNVCNHIIDEIKADNQVVVVVSAQGKTTDKLITEENEITDNPDKREHDVLLSTGEQITISKLSIALNTLGYQATSFTGWQLPIVTNFTHGNARIKYIDTEKITQELSKNRVVIIAGFQGINEKGDITTLGRGGSDTTAVALAACLKADRCDIYTDVDGVYSSDPRIIENVIKIDSISYDEMLELASLGAKVLHNRCVEIGKNFNVPIYVKSSFERNSIGTKVTNKKMIEDLCISGITKENNISRVTIIGKENKIGRIYQVFDLLAQKNINVDIIVQSFGEHISKDISFTVKNADLKKVLQILDEYSEELDIKEVKHCDKLSKVSIVGVGIANNPGVAARLFKVLYKNNINMHMISTSEIKISILVNNNVAENLLKEVHKEFIKQGK